MESGRTPTKHGNSNQPSPNPPRSSTPPPALPSHSSASNSATSGAQGGAPVLVSLIKPIHPFATTATTLSASTRHSQHGAQIGNPTSSSSSTTSKGISHRPAVFDKLEALVRDMQDDHHGVPVRSQKLFLTSIPSAFMGYDLIEWLMDRLSIEDSLEAVHLANLLCQFGYYFPVNELKNLIVKDDSSLYRFQTMYYWPSQHHTPDNIEYAIYLCKRSRQRNKQKHGLEDYELEAYTNLRKILASKWDFVTMQAEEQLKIGKDRKRGEKIVMESQEKAYWRVYRPPPGLTTVVESSPVPTREQRVKARSRTREHLTEEVEFLRNYSLISRSKVSQVLESLIEYTDDFYEFDHILSANSAGPSNPWITDDQTYWVLNQPIVECATEKRVRKWAMSLEDLISDQLGEKELMAYMRKEYSHENLRFWRAVQDLRTGPGSEAKIKKKVKEIWDEFLSPGAKAEINIDGKTMEATKLLMKNPTRYTYEVAAEHVYTLLLKKDCYPRFIRSDHYKGLVANSINPLNQKKRFPFPFVKKKISTAVTGPLQGGSAGTNPKAGLEGCNIYGADGSESGAPPEFATSGDLFGNSRHLSSFSSRDADDASICPWEIGDPAPAPTPAAPEDPSKPHHHSAPGGAALGVVKVGSNPDMVQMATSAASSARHRRPKSTSNPPLDLSPRRGSTGDPLSVGSNGQSSERVSSSGGLTRESSHRSSRSRRGTSSQAGTSGGDSVEGSEHRHHHHHEHHHSASKRAKSKSKRKKQGRSVKTSTTPLPSSSCPPSTLTSTSTCEKENLVQLVAGAAAVMSSAATTVAAAASKEQELMQDAVEISLATSSKCTQTKLDSSQVVKKAEEEEESKMSVDNNQASQDKENKDLPGKDEQGQQGQGQQAQGQESQQVQEEPQVQVQEGQQEQDQGKVKTEEEQGQPQEGQEGQGQTPQGQLGQEASGTTSPWPSTTAEVCPWEDEDDNNKESHKPFVKTYATLGYL